MRANVKGILYTGPDFFEPKYAFDGVKDTYLGAGFDEAFLAENKVVHKVCRGTVQLSKDCWLFADFPRIFDFETIPERFVRGSLPNAKKDDFSDEVCLAVDTSKGIVVISGMCPSWNFKYGNSYLQYSETSDLRGIRWNPFSGGGWGQN